MPHFSNIATIFLVILSPQISTKGVITKETSSISSLHLQHAQHETGAGRAFPLSTEALQ